MYMSEQVSIYYTSYSHTVLVYHSKPIGLRVAKIAYGVSTERLKSIKFSREYKPTYNLDGTKVVDPD